MVSKTESMSRRALSGDASGKAGRIRTQTQTQTQKKQVRRRLHSSRPYQERLLNMAEARREIVTALKQHRAAMRHADNKETQPQPQPQTFYSCSSCPDPSLLPIGSSPATNPPLNFLLPSQSLGLNLNFQDVNDMIQSSSSSSSSPICTINNPVIYSASYPPQSFSATTVFSRDAVGFHRTVDEEEMARMRRTGEKHEMEWKDTMNLVTSAWWLEFLKTVESSAITSGMEDDIFRAFDDVTEFPPWLSPTQDLLQPYHLCDYSSPHDPALSCMEIGEMEGMDWLA